MRPMSTATLQRRPRRRTTRDWLSVTPDPPGPPNRRAAAPGARTARARALQAGRERVVAARAGGSGWCSTRWPGACAPRRACGGRWPASATGGAQQLGHPPGQQAGDVLVAVVLVAEPRAVRLARRARASEASCTITWSGLPSPMGTKTAVGFELGDGGGQARAPPRRGGPVGRRQVLVVGELEPAVVGLEHLHGSQVLLAAGPPPHRHPA